jgi:hypothetical protein
MRHFLTLTIIAVLLVLVATVALAQVSVRGYYRKNGTYVAPHFRSAPDNTLRNNYGYPGNYNPNTGRITPGNPSRIYPSYNFTLRAPRSPVYQPTPPLRFRLPAYPQPRPFTQTVPYQLKKWR